MRRIEDAVDIFPDAVLPAQERRKLRRLAKKLDAAIYRNAETGKPVFSKPALLALARDRQFFGPPFEAAVRRELDQIDATGRKAPPAPSANWFEIASEIEGAQPQPDDLAERVRAATSEEELSRLLRERLPGRDEHEWQAAMAWAQSAATSQDPFGTHPHDAPIAEFHGLVPCLQQFWPVWYIFWLLAIIGASIAGGGPAGLVFFAFIFGMGAVGIILSCVTATAH